MIYSILCNINFNIFKAPSLNLCRGVFRTLPNTYGEDFGENNYFRQKAQSYMFNRLLNNRLLSTDKKSKEESTEGVLKNFANFAGKHLCWSLF